MLNKTKPANIRDTILNFLVVEIWQILNGISENLYFLERVNWPLKSLPVFSDKSS